jgi:hypothetical protein
MQITAASYRGRDQQGSFNTLFGNGKPLPPPALPIARGFPPAHDLPIADFRPIAHLCCATTDPPDEHLRMKIASRPLSQ